MLLKKKVNQEQFNELKQEIRKTRKESRNYFIGYVIGLTAILATTFGYTIATNQRMDNQFDTQLAEIRDIRNENKNILSELKDYKIKSLEERIKTYQHQPH